MANDFKDFSELKACVERNSGLLTVTMASLRDAQGASKLGRYIVEGIIDNLKQQGLKAYPVICPCFSMSASGSTRLARRSVSCLTLL